MHISKSSLYFILKIFFSLLIFIATLEVGLQAVSAFQRLKQRQWTTPSSATAPYIVIALGESTTAETHSQSKKSWASQLQLLFLPDGTKSINQYTLRNARIANEAEVGTTTTALLARFEDMLDRHQPKLVISMMGVNDTPSFWLRDYGLIKKENGIDWKTLKLLRYALNYRSINQRNAQKTLVTNTIQSHHFGYPDLNKMLSTLQKSDLNSADFSSQEELIKAFLNHRSDTEKAQFYVYIAQHIRPYWGKPPEQFRNAYYFYKKAFFLDPQVADSLDVSLLLASTLQKNDCRAMLDYADEKNVQLTSVTLGRAAVCLANESEYLNSLYSKVNHKFEYRPGDKSPTVRNYQRFYEILRQRNICWLAMGYPIRELSEAINTVAAEADPNYFFTLSNKEIFQDALKKSKYEDLFTDRFAGDFGHLTMDGARLIAENAYAKVKELQQKNLCGLEASAAAASSAPN